STVPRVIHGRTSRPSPQAAYRIRADPAILHGAEPTHERDVDSHQRARYRTGTAPCEDHVDRWIGLVRPVVSPGWSGDPLPFERIEDSTTCGGVSCRGLGA